MNVFSALNAQTPQSPTAAQQGANPWAPYASQAASQLNALNHNPNLVYGLPGYSWQQKQGQQQVGRSAAAAGAAGSVAGWLYGTRSSDSGAEPCGGAFVSVGRISSV